VQRPPRHFGVGPLGPTITPRNAVAALILLPGGRYLMQLRDDRPDIIYPGHWSCFGGAVKRKERPLDALRRELMEELELCVDVAREFAMFNFDLRKAGHGRFFRRYFELPITKRQASRLVLHEGSAVRGFLPRQLLHRHRVTPHDAFAIWLHASGARVQAA
jgi:8-oxo-dGTP pyrophosphatase MutT (NUDIX family)